MVFLAYLPCHTDMTLALKQAEVLRAEYLENKNFLEFSDLTLEIILSVNSYTPSDSEIQSANRLCDKVILNGENYLRDLNIANAFLLAQQLRPEYLWIISANDPLKRGGLTKVVREFFKDKEIDLVVASSGEERKYVERTIIDPPSKGQYYGVITGVVYKLQNFQQHLHNGPFLAWTGWSHLAVLQSAMQAENGLHVKTLKLEKLFAEGERDFTEIREFGYSIYGMLILESLFKPNKLQTNKFIKKFTLKNFYIWHIYKRSIQFSGNVINKKNYLGWNQEIAESIIWRASRITFALYLIVKGLPLRKIRNIQRRIINKST